MLRSLEEVLADVGPVGRECSGDSGLAAAVEVADAPVELLQCIFGCPPVSVDLVFQLAHLSVLARVLRSGGGCNESLPQ